MPVTGLSFPSTAESDSAEIEIVLNPGKEVEIPSGFVASPNVQSLIENGYLTPVEEATIKEQESEQSATTSTTNRAKNTTPEGK